MSIAEHETRTAGMPVERSQHVLFFGAAALLVAGEAVFWLTLAAIQSNSGVAALDGPVHDSLVASRNSVATAALTAVTTVTSPLWMTVVGFVLALLWGIRKRELWRPALLVAAMAATFGLSTFIKHQVNRARPPTSDFLLGPDDAFSFPSGHTFGAGVFAVVLAYLVVSRSGRTSTSVVAFAAAAAGTVVVAFSRIYLGYHWLTDVLASTGLAVAVLGIVILADGLRAARAPGPSRQGRPKTRRPGPGQ